MPIVDPTYRAKHAELREKQRHDSERADRMEYVKPAVMLGAGLVFISIYLTTQATANTPPAALIGAYYMTLVIGLAFGVMGLWLAAKLWLGGVGPLGLAVLRLAGIYVITDCVGLFVSGFMLIGLLIKAVVYICLLMWLFELEANDSMMLAFITFAIKVVAGIAIAMALMSAG